MTTNSQQEKLLPHEEPINAELLLRSQATTENILEQLRQKNNASGMEVDVVDYWGKSNVESMARRRVKASDVFIEYESKIKERKQRWLSQTQNQRTGQLYSLKYLIQNGVIDESERDLFEFPPGIEDFPYRQIYQFHRVKKADGSEYLSTHEQFTGINKNAAVITISVSDIHSYIKPKVSYELRNADGSPIQQGQNVTDSKTVQIASTRIAPEGEIAGTRAWLTPFTSEVANSALKMAHGSIGDPYNGCSLTLMKEGSRNPIGVNDVKLWAEGDFDSLFENLSKPQPQLNIDTKAFLNYVKHDKTAGEQYG